jgi:hypothetical protein
LISSVVPLCILSFGRGESYCVEKGALLSIKWYDGKVFSYTTTLEFFYIVKIDFKLF